MERAQLKKIGLSKYGQPLSSVERAWFSGYMLAAKERHVPFVTWLTVSPGGRVVKADGGHWFKRLYGSG